MSTAARGAPGGELLDAVRALDGRLAGASLAHLRGELRLARGTGAERAALGWTLRRLADDDPARGYLPAVFAAAGPVVLPAADSPAAAHNVAAVLADWRRAVAEAEPDAALRVLWPSADELSAARLAAAGFRQRGVFALRHPGPSPRVRADALRAGTVRRAGPDDLDAAFALHREENDFLREVGLAQGSTGTGGRASYKRMAAGLAGEGPSVVHLVDVAGQPVAVCESWPVEVTEAGATGGHSAGWLLPPGRYAYLHSVGVTASHRGRGLGALLVAGVLDDLPDAADGTFLWYEAGNPLSPGFWQAMGYRPLWTAHQRPVQP